MTRTEIIEKYWVEFLQYRNDLEAKRIKNKVEWNVEHHHDGSYNPYAALPEEPKYSGWLEDRFWIWYSRVKLGDQRQ